MTKYSKEFKESLVLKILAGPKQSIRAVASEAKVGISSLHGWVQAAKKAAPFALLAGNVTANKRAVDLSLEEKFHLVTESVSLQNEELNHYCRQKGIFKTQLEQWKLAFMTDKEESTSSKKMAAELKQLRLQNKQLQQELHRKDRALAEAAALLILKKKADLIWPVSEDDLLQ